jgi:hypothetical protein
MGLESGQERDGESAAERLSELTGEPAEKFEYDGEIPDVDELERERVDE